MKKEIEIKKTKPRLAYSGMEKVTPVEAVPTQVIEIVYPSKAQKIKNNDEGQSTLYEQGQAGTARVVKSEELPKNRLIWTSDNLVALKSLLDEKDPISGEYKYRGKVDLIYIDPPFMVQDDFVASNTIDIEIDDEEGIASVKEPTVIEMLAYRDTWQDGLDSFLQMMRERLILLKDLLTDDGAMFVHLDWHTSHYVKVLMDDIFDYQVFRNEIKVKRIQKNVREREKVKRMNNAVDVILFYAKTDSHLIQPPEKYAPKEERWHGFDAPGIRNGLDYKLLGYRPPAGRHWSWTKENAELAVKEGRIRKNPNTGKPEYLIEASDYQLLGDLWDDIPAYSFRTGYPTEKNVGLIKRIIEMSCPQNGIVLDAFIGSGTTCEAVEQLAEELNCSWIGMDNSKFGIHTARKRLIELNSKSKGEKGKGVYKVRPFTVENLGYYQRGVKWDAIQTSNQADTYRKAIIELFGGEYVPYSKLLHGKKSGAWIHVGPLSAPIIDEQIKAIIEEVKGSPLEKVYILSADYTAKHNPAKYKKKYGVDVMVRIIPASAIDAVKKRLQGVVENSKNPKKYSEPPNLAFFAPLTIRAKTTVDAKEVLLELIGCEVDAESFLESQKPERREELEKWLNSKDSWKSFVDFWAIDWNYRSLRDGLDEPVFENEWQSFRKRQGKKVVEDLTFKAFHTYEQPGEYIVAVKVTDVFGNDGITTIKVEVK